MALHSLRSINLSKDYLLSPWPALPADAPARCSHPAQRHIFSQARGLIIRVMKTRSQREA